MIEIANILEVEKNIADVEAVIFDLDDTLYSEKDYVRSGYKKISEYLQNPQIELDLWDSFVKGEKAIDVVFNKYGIIEKKEIALSIYRNQKPEIKLYDGVCEMISRIRKKKKIGIITDGRPVSQYAKIAALGIEADKIVVTDELGGIEFRKPNKKAFVIMQECFEVPFEKMVYIGDNILKDFVAPTNLGMKSIYFRNVNGLYYFS
ncbi:HAD family hydrolase [uncultured Eubacterium sp.]|uniref:HAD family hydrolase n=1 Tax=uncultured Eubacterium sp. TaxID=165185 RepID=UPI00262F2ECF|nr:HAD family hydrolase [uncultured Eubacterium sp.]